MDGVASFSVEREGPRRARARPADGTTASATWAPIAAYGVSVVLLALCAFGRQKVVYYPLRESLPSLELLALVAAIACGVCVALLRAHARGVPYVGVPTLAIASAPLLAGAAAARIDWVHAMPLNSELGRGPEHGMFVFGVGALASVALLGGVAIALRRIAASEPNSAAAPWLAMALGVTTLEAVLEAFARWGLPRAHMLAEASDRSLRDWDTLLSALLPARVITGIVVGVLIVLAVVAAVRRRSPRAGAAIVCALLLMGAVATTVHAVAGGAEQLVASGPAFQLERVPELVPVAVTGDRHDDAIDLVVGTDFVADESGRHLSRAALAELARARSGGPRTDDRAAVNEFLWEMYYPRRGLGYLPRVSQLDVVVDARLTTTRLARVLDELASAGVTGIRIVGPNPLVVPPESLRSPLLRVGARRYASMSTDIEGSTKKLLLTNPLRARVTAVHDGTLDVAATFGPARTWNVDRENLISPVHQAGADADALVRREPWEDTSQPLIPYVVWVPVTLGTTADVIGVAAQLDRASVIPVICARACP